MNAGNLIGSKIVKSIWLCNSLRYISYGGSRWKKARIFKLIPEAREIDNHFASPFGWYQKMQTHNQALQRGERMRLHHNFKIKPFLCHSLDVFILQMHSKEIAKALISLTTFGKRVRELVQRDPLASEWWFHHDLLVQQRHWKSLCNRMVKVILLMRFFISDDSFSVQLPPSHRWPDREVLVEAVSSAASVFQGPVLDCPRHSPTVASTASITGAAARLPAGPGQGE